MVSTPQPPSNQPPRPSMNRPMQPSVGAPSRKPRKRKRRWIVRLLWLMLILVIFVAIFPYLAAWVPGIRNFLLAKAVPNLNGSITAKSASLGWEKPIAFQGISIYSASQMPVVEIEELKGDRPLWKILLKPSVLGTYTIKKPYLTIVVYPDGTTNLSEVFTGINPMSPGLPPKKIPDVSLAVRLVDGSVKVCDHLGQNDWVAGPINFHFRIEPSSNTSDGRTWLLIPNQKVFDHVQVTPQVCHDMLQYIAPLMAQATEVKGSFSIDLKQWKLPFDTPSEGTGKGTFTVHKFSVNAGPIIEPVLRVLHIPSELISIDEAPIQFELTDGRMHHKGLQFHVGQFKFTTSGSVGIKDKSLDMTMAVEFPEDIRPLIKKLVGPSISIPIRGTLQRPEVDLQKLIQLNISVEAIPQIIRAARELLDKGRGEADEKGPEAKTGDALDKTLDTVDTVLEGIRRRRESSNQSPLFPLLRRQSEEEKTPDLLPADAQNVPETPPKTDRGIFGEGGRRLFRDRPLLKRLLAPPGQENKEPVDK